MSLYIVFVVDVMCCMETTQSVTQLLKCDSGWTESVETCHLLDTPCIDLSRHGETNGVWLRVGRYACVTS